MNIPLSGTTRILFWTVVTKRGSALSRRFQQRFFFWSFFFSISYRVATAFQYVYITFMRCEGSLSSVNKRSGAHERGVTRALSVYKMSIWKRFNLFLRCFKWIPFAFFRLLCMYIRRASRQYRNFQKKNCILKRMRHVWNKMVPYRPLP